MPAQALAGKRRQHGSPSCPRLCAALIIMLRQELHITIMADSMLARQRTCMRRAHVQPATNSFWPLLPHTYPSPFPGSGASRRQQQLASRRQCNWHGGAHAAAGDAGRRGGRRLHQQRRGGPRQQQRRCTAGALGRITPHQALSEGFNRAGGKLRGVRSTAAPCATQPQQSASRAAAERPRLLPLAVGDSLQPPPDPHCPPCCLYSHTHTHDGTHADMHASFHVRRRWIWMHCGSWHGAAFHLSCGRSAGGCCSGTCRPTAAAKRRCWRASGGSTRCAHLCLCTN